MFYELAQADIPALQGWLQIATSTGFVGLAWYLIVIALPNMQRRFDEHSDKQMQAFSTEIERSATNHEKQIKMVVELMAKHDNGN